MSLKDDVENLYEPFEKLHRKVEAFLQKVNIDGLTKEELEDALNMTVSVTRLAQDCSSMLYNAKETLQSK